MVRRLERPSRWERAKSKTIIAGLLVTILAMILLYLSSESSPGARASIIESFGSVLLTIGVVTIIHDFWIKTSFLDEVMDLVGLERHLVSAGIRQIAEESSVPWLDIYKRTTSFFFLLLDPGVSLERDWPHLLTAARERIVHINFYLPDPSSSDFEGLARKLGLSVEDFGQTISRAKRVIEDGWKMARDSDPGLKPGSTLVLVFYDGAPGYSLIALDNDCAIVMDESLTRVPGDSPIAFVFSGDNGGRIVAKLLDQASRVRTLDYVPQYSDEVPAR